VCITQKSAEPATPEHDRTGSEPEGTSEAEAAAASPGDRPGGSR
jgi:hypothetical protein